MNERKSRDREEWNGCAGAGIKFKKWFRCQDLLAPAAKSPGSILMNLKIAVSTTASISDY